MADRVSPEVRSRIMRAIRSRWTRQERTFAGMVSGWERGGKAERNADFIFRQAKVAVFLDGDFWHGRVVPESLPMKWKEKLARNAERDVVKREELQDLGWEVLQAWESDFLKDPQSFVDDVKREVERRTV